MPISNIRTIRDFYAFEQHVKTCRAQRGLGMVDQWYRIPVFYFSNPNSVIGNGDPVVRPKGSRELDFELEIAAIIGEKPPTCPMTIEPWSASQALRFTTIGQHEISSVRRWLSDSAE